MTTDRREAIISAALEVIQDHGISALTQTRVAERAEMRQSHLTYYFPTRGELLAATADAAVALRLHALAPTLSATDVSGKLTALADVLTDPGQTRLLLALIQTADTDEGVRAAFTMLRDGIDPLAVDLLNSARAPIDPVSRQLVQTTSTGIAILALASGGPRFHRNAVLLLENLLAGLIAAASTSATAPATATATEGRT